MVESQSSNPISSAEVRQQPCLLCGGDSFAWGFFNPGSSLFTFKTDNDSWLVRYSGLGGAEVKARACKTCGNLQMFVK